MTAGRDASESRLVLGVDGGNTKTVAVVAAPDGTVIAHARGGCTDVYGAVGASAALDELVRVITDACSSANIDPPDLGQTIFCLAGADCPEDHALYEREIGLRLGLARPVVHNDAIGSLYAGRPDGVGVAVAYGTYCAIGARSPDGFIWHSSQWMVDPAGAHGLGSLALRATYRADLGIDPPTTLSTELPRAFGVTSTKELLHLFTRREEPLEGLEVTRAARIVLNEAARGDEVSRELVVGNGAVVGEYVIAGAMRVRLGPEFEVVLAGGVFAHESRLLEDAIADAVSVAYPQARTARATLPPVAGALTIALERSNAAGLGEARLRVASTLPEDLRVPRPPRRELAS